MTPEQYVKHWTPWMDAFATLKREQAKAARLRTFCTRRALILYYPALAVGLTLTVIDLWGSTISGLFLLALLLEGAALAGFLHNTVVLRDSAERMQAKNARVHVEERRALDKTASHHPDYSSRSTFPRYRTPDFI